ncbi:hypothetical protein [Plebeiibacterium sediminum]|uniref:Uncharacterized protein n=1 Tax=Plebeiibacterium sediminum TaxID=2992112 RepID=A0AAE3SG41_9BACT|nr:hypothetical protein [Plebeiobacterium sediminum]MCW3787906.1 hypothetical protein [Plebeiobacterium sediminum]
MWNNLSYKKRFYRIIIGLILLICLSYKFAFQNTLLLKDNLEQLKTELRKIENAPYKLNMIQQKLDEIDTRIGDVNFEIDKGGYLIDIIGDFCKRNDLVLNEIPQKHVFNKENFNVVTFKVLIEGSFKRQLQLLNEIEDQPIIGKVRSVCFESKYDLKLKKKFLYGSYLFQSLKESN